jgi:UDP-N-acetyl-2-amino-2-deoxyglucuronate dehydrogenase
MPYSLRILRDDDPRLLIFATFMQQPLRFGIIGCGKIAPRHAAQAALHGRLTAICDIIPERAQAFAQSYNAQAFSSVDEMLQSGLCDVIAVCSPNGLHSAHTIAALDAGCHVLCEKPMSTSTADALQMEKAALAAGKKLFVVKSTRYNPALAALKELIRNGSMGELLSFQLTCLWNRPAAYYENSWKGQLDMDGGTLFTQFSHYIDALLWLTDDELAEANGYRRNRCHQEQIQFEDEGIAAVQLSKGVWGGITWSVNSFRKNMEVSLSLLGTKGSVRIGGEYMNRVEYQLLEEGTLQVPESGGPNDYGHYQGSMSNHDQVYLNLVKALADGDHPFANAKDGIRTVSAIEKIYKSLSLR